MPVRDIMTMRKAHETLCEYKFEIIPLNRGYANRTLRIDLDKNEVSIQPVSEQMKNLWVGGKGFDLWLMLQEITKNTKWYSNENPICFATGPLGGTTSFPGSGKTLITSISPVTNSIMDSNVGGHFGPFFKFAGFDALTIVGKAREDVIILIDSILKKIIIEKAPHESIDSAKNGYIYIRKEYPLALKRLEHAIVQARQRGLLGEKILGSNFSFEIEIHRGAGAFVCGESTALMTSMSGMPGEPRAKYVHNVEFGYRNKPTVLNNVETWANIPLIINRGAQWFSGIGTGDVGQNPWNGSSGTKAFSLAGNINNTGLIEVPMGITLREIIFDIGGGIPRGRKFKTVQTGGPSGGCLPERFLDVKVDFDMLTEAGSMMGSGGMIILITYSISDNCTGCVLCAKGCPSNAIYGEKKKKHVVISEKCIKCDICFERCKFNAVEVK